MTFSDKNLKQLKDLLNGDLPEFSTWSHADLKVLKALLARLEAAEKCVELCSTDENCCAIPEFGPKGNVPDAISWLEVWRKACGK
jgi:hypothetical protein